MRLRDSDIDGLPVFTTSEQKIGVVAGIIVDADSHAVVQYAVTRSRLLSKLLPKELLIHPSRVVSLDNEKMVVDDDAAKAESSAALELPETITSAVSTMTMK